MTPTEKFRHRMELGMLVGEGKAADVQLDVTKVEKPEEYWTRPGYEKVTSLSQDYVRWTESEDVQKAISAVPGGIWGAKVKEGKWAPERFITGATQFPAALANIVASMGIGAEHIVKTKGEVFKDMPIAAAVMVGGMKHEIETDPLRLLGEMSVLPFVPKFVPRGKVPHIKIVPQTLVELKPSMFKTKLKVPKGLTPEQVTKFKAGAEIAVELEKVKPPMMQPLKFTEVKSLPGKSGLIVEKWIKTHPKQESVIAGSTAARAQFKGSRLPGDIDLYVKDPIKAGKQIYKLLEKELGKDKTKLTIQKEWGSAVVEVKIKGEWHHAVDIHPSTRAGEVMEFGLKTREPITIGEMKYVSAGELVQRKAASILMSRKEGKIGPKSYRTKDILDFETYVESVVKAKKVRASESSILFKKLRESQSGKLEHQLETYKMYSYGPEAYMAKTMIKQYERLPISTKILASVMSKEIIPYEEPTKVPTKTVSPYMIPVKKVSYDYTNILPTYKKPIKAKAIPDKPYIPPYVPPYEASYVPPYVPPYKPPYEKITKPPYKPPFEELISKEPIHKPKKRIKPKLKSDLLDMRRKKLKLFDMGYLERKHLIGDPLTILAEMGKPVKSKGMGSMFIHKPQGKLKAQFSQDNMFGGILPKAIKKTRKKVSKRTKKQVDMFHMF